MKKKILDILKNIDVIEYKGDLNTKITGICIDSRKIEKDNLFFAIKGNNHDSIIFLDEVIKRGGNSVITINKFNKKYDDLVWIRVDNDRETLASISSCFFDNPSKKSYLIGITGTNGKTTTLSIISHILNKVEKTAYMGTLGMKSDKFIKTHLTTPESPDLNKFMYESINKGYKNFVMEVSSVALKLKRVHSLSFSQAIFTNLSGDHLDFHKTMEDYFNSKLQLFRDLEPDKWAVLNVDDESFKDIINVINCRYITYGIKNKADVYARDYEFGINGINANVITPIGKIRVKSKLRGKFNLMNILAAISSLILKHVDIKIIEKGLEEITPIRGRLEPVYDGKFKVFIDYAHTDGALYSLLKSVREMSSSRIILVFGAGGSRDKTKRPRMGKVASENADYLIITSDNPRKEKPIDIINDILKGINNGFKDYKIEIDREKAIKIALDMAKQGDIVIIAGKGHEDYQIFKEKTVHFDDKEVVEKIMESNNA